MQTKTYHNHLSPSETLEEAIRVIGYKPVSNKPTQKGWITFWCPFHDDIGRKGHSGRPNFGLNVESGGWTCFVCGRSGGSLAKLAKELGKEYVPRAIPDALKYYAPAHKSHVNSVSEALDECRANFMHSPARVYVRDRGVRPLIAATYGLGYGIPNPAVDHDTYQAALQSGLVMKKSGTWLWAESMVYSDPPTGTPTVINCRYLPDRYLERSRPFQVEQNHRTWGNRTVPLGSWRIGPATQTILVVEGLFDMLVTAQIIQDKKLQREVCAVYTNGAMVAGSMLKWFKEHSREYDFVLIRDPDEAGLSWESHLKDALADGKPITLTPPDHLDPDEAFLSGWWPSGI
jgi:Toprim-like